MTPADGVPLAGSLAVQHVFTMTCTIAPAIEIPDAPGGNRLLLGITGGTFTGERLRGTVASSPGGDWAIRDVGSTRIDVRLALQPDDGAPILLTYQGVSRRIDGERQVRVAARFETSPGPNAWLNDVVAVGVGRVGAGEVTYDFYELT